MSIFLSKWKTTLFHNIFKNSSNVFLISSRNKSAVDLAHQVYGQLGSVTPIIIIHGLVGSKRNWQGIAKKIQEKTNFPIIAVDARNHGESPHTSSHTYMDLAADIRQLMDKKGLQKAVLIGHSMGGRASMVFALTQPEKVSALVVVDISPVSSPNILSDDFPNLVRAMKTITFDVDTVAKARQKAKTELLKSGTIDEGATLNFLVMNIGTRDGKLGWLVNMETLHNNYNEIASFPSVVAGKTYQGPTIFIAGSRSKFVPQSDLTGIQGIFPKAELKYVDAGHNLHIEKTDEFVSLVSQFLKGSVK